MKNSFQESKKTNFLYLLWNHLSFDLGRSYHDLAIR